MRIHHGLVLAALVGAGARAQEPGVDRVSELEAELGWRALFDGSSTAAWVGHGTDAFPDGWDVVDGCLHKQPGVGGGDLVTRESFSDFELELEWKVAPGANSGIKYRVAPAEGPGAMLGPEYQVLDDAAHPDVAPTHTAGALYDLYAPKGKVLAPRDGFHRARIVVRGNRVEHWLDGRRVVACEIGGVDFRARVSRSKFAGVDGFAAPRPGPIGLQDHGGEVWFRRIRVRPWPPPGEEVELFTGWSLEGWRELGDADYSPSEHGILGKTGGGGQSFLVTERTFGDFVLELELQNVQAGNSGIQIRSHQRESGRVYGYQVEIDPSPRAWSGGLYDEARRGWLDDLADSPEAREAFLLGEWNWYRIECAGPWIRTWVNGVPAADFFDFADLEGFFGLQVHSGRDTWMFWRTFRLLDLGHRSWRPVAEALGVDAPEGGWTLAPASEDEPALLVLPGVPADFALRARFREEGARLRVAFRCTDRAFPDLGELEHAGGGIHVSDTVCVFDPGDAELAETRAKLAEGEFAGWLGLASYGRRLVAQVDGAQAIDLRDAPPATRAGAIVLEARGPSGTRVVLDALELLGPPADHR